jgi:hypothetical protein
MNAVRKIIGKLIIKYLVWRNRVEFSHNYLQLALPLYAYA